MTAGLSILNTHHVWTLDWPVILTILGWALVIGGAVRVIAPGIVDDVGSAMVNHPTITRVMGGVWGLLGVFLSFKGYG